MNDVFSLKKTKIYVKRGSFNNFMQIFPTAKSGPGALRKYIPAFLQDFEML